MNRFIAKFLQKQLRLEHIIYCATDCKIELPLHKWYYDMREKKYNSYLERKAYLKRELAARKNRYISDTINN